MLEMKGPIDDLQGLDISPNSASSCVASDESFNLSDLNFLIQKLEVRRHNFPKPPLDILNIYIALKFIQISNWYPASRLVTVLNRLTEFKMK